MDSKTILICDDDPTVRSSLSLVLKRAGYGIATAETPEQAVAQIRTTIPGLILMDMNYTRSTTGEEGLELLAKVKVLAPEVPVILITAWGSIHLAVQGIRAGAFDFITKPWNNLALLESIRTAIQVQESSTAADAAPKSPFRRDKIIGKSPLLERVLQTVSRIASTHAPVLITGESGTGKELLAHALHQAGPRRNGPFVALNCGALPDSLLESELFGYDEGAFTGARRGGKEGLFEMAQDGSIFLDEIADISPAVQIRLLRVLETGEIFRLGGDRPIAVNARVISSSWKDLVEEVRSGRFRADLYYRLSLLRLQTPPLRERPEDIPLLARHILARLNMAHKELSPHVLGLLKDYAWPGNVRELDALLRRYCLLSDGGQCDRALLEKLLDDLRATQGLLAPAERPADKAPTLPDGRAQGRGNLRERLETLEREIIRAELEKCAHNRGRAAKNLGISANTLWRKMKAGPR